MHDCTVGQGQLQVAALSAQPNTVPLQSSAMRLLCLRCRSIHAGKHYVK